MKMSSCTESCDETRGTLLGARLFVSHIGTESTTEGLQARTSASRPIRFQQSSQQQNLIGLEALVRACSPSVVLSVPMCTLKAQT